MFRPANISAPYTPFWVHGWVLACVLLSALGWLLSICGQLNHFGYSVGLLLTAAGLIYSVKRGVFGGSWHLRRFKRRFRRPLPAAFLLLLLLATIGGSLYQPNNYDALAYRIPRVLHWLAEGKWVWVESPRGWLNTRACGFEWLSAPILLFFRSDRPLFLLNIISFLLLPGLVFSFFTRLGMPARVAWRWMWLVPTGTCFVIQAGSLANDLYGAVLALAAMDFALRARVNRRVSDLWFSVLAAGAMTNAKSSNLVLLLPWAIAILPAARLALSRPAISFGVVSVGILGSFLPTAVLNHLHCGDWTGMAAEDAWMRPPSPLVSVAHNAALLFIQNFSPPVLPMAGSFNGLIQNLLPESWKATVDGFAESGRWSYAVRELPGEEHAGAGLILTLLVLIAAVGNWSFWRRQHSRRVAFLLGATLLSLVVFMSKSGIAVPGRLVAPFYALLIPLLIGLGANTAIFRTRWWHALEGAAFAVAALVLILSPSRPLWPALTVLNGSSAAQVFPQGLRERARTVYAVYRNRGDHFAPVRSNLPADIRAIGLVTSTEAETSLWRPLGTRRVFHVGKNTSLEQLNSASIEFILVNTGCAEALLGRPLARWLSDVRGEITQQFTFNHLASGAPSQFVLVRAGVAPQAESTSLPLSRNAN